jgi:hypothetical protein
VCIVYWNCDYYYTLQSFDTVYLLKIKLKNHD